MWRPAPLGLRDRFILSSTALITVLMSIVIFFVEKEQTAVLKARAEEHGMAVARAVAQLSENRLMYYDLVALQQNMENTAEDEDVLFAIIFNRKARTLAANEEAREIFPPAVFEMSAAEMGTLERNKVSRDERPIQTKDGRTLDVLVMVAPVFVEDQLWGAVKLGLSLSKANAEIERIRVGLISLGFLGLTFGALGSVLLANRISRPLESLVEGTIRVARGDLSHRIDIPPGDEIGELASNFNRMTAEILDDRRKLEEASRKLMDAEKLATIGRLATALAHEIRNPLTAVKLNIQKISHHPALNQTEREQISIAESGIQQVEKLVKDILSYARAPMLTKAAFQLESLLEDALRFVEEPVEEKEIRVITEWGEIRPIDVDADQLRQAFLNVLLNATEAVGQGGTIRVRTRLERRDEGEFAVAEIEDDGAGIGANELSAIFEAFFTTKSLGTGLGLTNAKKVVELHRGVVEVESEPGHGTKVRVRLPYGDRGSDGSEDRQTQETALTS